MSGERLNPRKADLHRWRETFAERLRGWGVVAEATRQATRGEGRRFDNLWQLKARQDGRLRSSAQPAKSGEAYQRSRIGALEAWAHIVAALSGSDQAEDRVLAQRIGSFMLESSFGKEHGRQRDRQGPAHRDHSQPEPLLAKDPSTPEIER